MSRNTLIPGFDYRTRRAVQMTRAQWQAEMALVLAAGGSRRAEAGETFVHAPPPTPEIVFEIYAIVPAPKERATTDESINQTA